MVVVSLYRQNSFLKYEEKRKIAILIRTLADLGCGKPAFVHKKGKDSEETPLHVRPRLWQECL
jgi:hypothetical protein